METQKAQKVDRCKTSIAIVAALCCLVIYILACVLPPATWSPDSSKIAFLVSSGDKIDKPDRLAVFAYDISTGKRVLLDKIDFDKGRLSAPSWSPDGNWIAYYRIEPSGAEHRPDVHAEPNLADWDEESIIIPNLLIALIDKTYFKPTEEYTWVNLMSVSPDGKEKKVLAVIPFNDSLEAEDLVYFQPQWSNNSKCIYYSRLLFRDLYGIGSLNIETGQACLHLLSSIPFFSVSPDGKWVASFLKDTSEKMLLSIAKVDGTIQKYFRHDDFNVGQQLAPISIPSWSPDSIRLAVHGKEYGFCIINIETGNVETYWDPEADDVFVPRFSPDGSTVYYLARDKHKEVITLKSYSLADGKTAVITLLPVFQGIGSFGVSPSGKMFLVKGVIEKEDKEKLVLYFWDGKTWTMVETDHWLK